MTTHLIVHPPRAATTWRNGLAVGAAAAIAAIAAHLVVVAATGRDYPQLTVLSITLATLVAVLAGAWIYRLLLTRARRPAIAFAVLAAVAAVADTLLAMQVGPDGGFVLEAGVLHVVVAAVAAVALPRVLRGGSR